jgi:tetratricopeptide (TPR) repeat protein
MATSRIGEPAPQDKSASAARLDGWKDIAAYLGKAERTVKRWESNRGLPIRRLPGGAKASVYAYGFELDRWLTSSASDAPDPEPSAPPADSEPLAPQVSAPAPNPALPELPSPARFLGRRWISAVLSLSVAGSAMGLLLVSSGMPLSKRIQAIFASKATGSASAVSEGEKQLARDLYLKGRYEWNQRTPDSLTRALDLFTQAIVHDPSYAQAYAGLADTYDLLREYSTMPDEDAFPRAIAAARKAVELDDTLAEAHRALAFAERYGSWDFDDSEKQFRRAIELDPNDAQARRWYANAFAVPGRFEESLEQINKAQELDPASNVTLADKGNLLATAGRIQEAIDLLKEVERSSPGFSSPHSYLARIALDQGDYPTYLTEEEHTAETTSDPVLKQIVTSARSGYAREGSAGLLKALYVKQKQHYLEGKFLASFFAQTCVLVGKRQEALQLLETAYARRENEVVAVLSDPVLLTMKSESRYKVLVAKIQFPMRPAGAPLHYAAQHDNPSLAIFNRPR